MTLLQISCVVLLLLFVGACVIAGVLKSRLQDVGEQGNLWKEEALELRNTVGRLANGYTKLSSLNIYGHDEKGRIKKLTEKELKKSLFTEQHNTGLKTASYSGKKTNQNLKKRKTQKLMATIER